MFFQYRNLFCVALAIGLLMAGSSRASEFMLTFDDGPLPGATDKVLHVLAGIRAEDGQPVKAGFFLLGAVQDAVERRKYFAPYEMWSEKGSLAAHPELVRQILATGHLIGNHSTHHAWFRWPWLNDTEAVREEISTWEKLAAGLLDPAAPRLFRPPYLVDTPAVRQAAAEAGYQVVMGVSSGDAAPLATPYAIVERVSGILSKWDQSIPCVLVFHDTRPATQQGLVEIVNALQARGFRLAHFDPARLKVRLPGT
ncbi:MAG: polysaccharide deacetylase family protein [Sulfuricella denitrificans]|nr:polysaccharide deacetylase family protein [Sulfuricella denitrificans]